ncbi:hypothetical protein H4R35_007275, partial [Dimargaris xerosporica]
DASPVQRRVYTVHWDHAKDRYVFIDEYAPEMRPTVAQTRQYTGYDMVHPYPIAIHRVRFNPNPGAWMWLASGGGSGLVRVEAVSSDWSASGPGHQ